MQQQHRCFPNQSSNSNDSSIFISLRLAPKYIPKPLHSHHVFNIYRWPSCHPSATTGTPTIWGLHWPPVPTLYFSKACLYLCIRVSNTCRWPSCHPSATAGTPTVWGLLGLLCLLWGLVMGPLSWPTRPDRTRLVIGQTRLQSRGK